MALSLSLACRTVTNDNNAQNFFGKPRIKTLDASEVKTENHVMQQEHMNPRTAVKTNYGPTVLGTNQITCGDTLRWRTAYECPCPFEHLVWSSRAENIDQVPNVHTCQFQWDLAWKKTRGNALPPGSTCKQRSAVRKDPDEL